MAPSQRSSTSFTPSSSSAPSPMTPSPRTTSSRHRRTFMFSASSSLLSSPGMHEIRAPHRRRRQHHCSLLILSALLSSSMLTPRVDAQGPTTETPKNQLDPVAAPPVGPGTPAPRPTTDMPTTDRTTFPRPTNNPRPTTDTTPIAISPTIVPPPTTTTTTTTVRTFSDNIITISGSSSAPSTKTTSRIQQPSETPYGYFSTNDTNGGMMLTVSLVVVFVVLSAMGLVVFYLFKRRNAKHRMGLFGKTNNGPSTNGLDDFVSPGAGARKRESIKGASGSEMDLNQESLQEMSEQHQNTLMTRRSSTLSLGSLQQQPQHVNRGSMLSPALSPARPSSVGSNYWRGSVHGTPSLGHQGSAHNSMVMSNDSVPRAMSPEFRSSQYDDYYGPPHASYMYPGGTSSGAGSINYNSNEQLMQYPQPPFSHHNGSGSNMSRRSSLSPGTYPHQPETQNSPVIRSKTISVAHSSGAYATPPQQHYSQQAQQPHRTSYHSQHISVPAPAHQQSRTDSAPISTNVSNSSEDLSESNITTSTHSSVANDTSGEEQKRSLLPVGSGTINHPSEHGWRPQSMSALPGSGVGAHVGMPPHDDSGRPLSMMGHHHPSTKSHPSSPANLVIPPSITTRRRSQLNHPNTSSIYLDHGMGMQPPMPGYYTNPHNVYYHQPPPPSTASSGSGSGSRRNSQPLDHVSYQEVVVEVKDEPSS